METYEELRQKVIESLGYAEMERLEKIAQDMLKKIREQEEIKNERN